MSLPSVAVCRVAIFVLPAVLWRIAFLLFAGCLVSFAADVSPFYLPIRNNDVAALKELLRARWPKARDARGNSPLMYAAALGTPDVLRLLLDAGADPNAANELGGTPLMWCAGDAAKVKLLLAKGYRGGALVKLLLEHGAAVNAKSDDTSDSAGVGPSTGSGFDFQSRCQGHRDRRDRNSPGGARAIRQRKAKAMRVDRGAAAGRLQIR
jgi:Ankyrin repeats (3 copies)